MCCKAALVAISAFHYLASTSAFSFFASAFFFVCKRILGQVVELAI
jgi:hypothetical protein